MKKVPQNPVFAKLLSRICFECANSAASPFGSPITRKHYPKPVLGGTVNADTCCKDCPVAAMRGTGAKISAGQPDPVFSKMLVPTEECAQQLTANDTWLPCCHCDNAKRDAEGNVYIQDLSHCFEHCPVIEIRDALQEQEAEAGCS